MNKSLIYLAIGISVASASASATGVVPTAVPTAAAMITGARQIAKDAGFPTDDIVVAQAPPSPQSVAAAGASKEEIREALPALIAAATKNDNDTEATLVALGINLPLNSILFKSIPTQKDVDGWRAFTVMTFSGEQRIRIDRYLKSDKRGRNYLLAMDGTLIAAAKTGRNNEGFFAEKIQIPEAQAGYEDLLSWWVQYYRDNLKGKEHLTARN